MFRFCLLDDWSDFSHYLLERRSIRNEIKV